MADQPERPSEAKVADRRARRTERDPKNERASE